MGGCIVQAHPSESIVQTVGMLLTGSITPGVGGEAMLSLLTGGITYDSATACTLTLESAREGNQFMVDVAGIYARFDCPNLVDPPTTGCTASGAFAVEGCSE